jgi:hypothetical protein
MAGFAMALFASGCALKSTSKPSAQANAMLPGSGAAAAGASMGAPLTPPATPSTNNLGPVAAGNGGSGAAPSTTPGVGPTAGTAGRAAAPPNAAPAVDAGAATVDAATPSSTSYWHPKAGTTWDWQLSSVDTSHMVEVYDIDYENPQSTIDALHAKNIHVICYVSVGSVENYRPDANAFPASVVGNAYPGWPDEKFLDIRSPMVRTLMSARFDLCKSKGFDGLEPDNMDVFEDKTGFPLTAADGLDYAQWLADQAHTRGLAIFQKNASSLAPKLFDLYDGAITEDCFDQGWCNDMSGYVQRDKPVFMAEYTDTNVNFPNACSYAKTNKYSAILKDRDLTSMLMTCP